MGTLVRDDATGAVMADLVEDGQTYTAAKGAAAARAMPAMLPAPTVLRPLPKRANPAKTVG